MPVDPYEIFAVKDAPADSYEQFARPDFAANPPGMPGPPKVDMQYSTLGALYNPSSVPKEVRQGITNAPLPGSTEGAGLAGGLGEYVGSVGSQIGSGAKNIWQGNIAQGAHEIIGGGMTALAPAVIPSAVAAPIPTAAVMGASYLGGKLAKYGAKGLGASPEQALLAEDVGNILTGYGTVKAAGGIKALMEGPGAPAERLSVALSKTMPKQQWAKVNERLQALGDAKVQEVVGGAKDVGGVAVKMKARSLALDDQFSNAIEPVKGNDITPQVARLRASLEQEAVNADPYRANAYRAMADKVSEVKTLDQLNQLVKGINKGNRFSAGPESMVRQSLTQTVQGLTGQDFSPLRLEQSHWMTLARATQKAAIPEQLQAIQSKVTSPGRKLAQAATTVPMSKLGAILQGAKLLQPSAKSLIRGIEAPSIEPPVARPSPAVGESAVDMATRRPPVRTAEAEQIRNALLQNQNIPRGTGMNTSGLDPATATNEDIMNWIRQNNPAAQGPAREMNPARAGTTAEVSAEYNPQVVQQHGSALEQAKAQLPNGTLSEQLQLAAKIQRGGQ